jgi:hypothetical protein
MNYFKIFRILISIGVFHWQNCILIAVLYQIINQIISQKRHNEKIIKGRTIEYLNFLILKLSYIKSEPNI